MSKTSLPSVLLAVKEDALQRIIRDFLRGYGIQSVGVCSTANEAVNHLRAAPGKWDVFILDGAFPDAFEKVVEIRGELNSPVQIIAILADPTEGEIVEAVQAGVNDFLATPFTQNTLERKLDAMVKRRKTPPAPSPFSVPMG